jgi:hypothetical protein
MVRMIVSYFEFTGEYSVSVFSKGLQFILSRVDDYRSNETDTLRYILGNTFIVRYSSRQNNCINLSADNCSKSCNILRK